MEENTKKIISAIEEKRERLKEKTTRCFTAIKIPTGQVSLEDTMSSKRNAVPPISYISYGGAVCSAIGAMSSDTKWPFLLLTAGLAYAGYRFSNKPGSSNRANHTGGHSLNDLKNTIMQKGLDVVKKTTTEWEEFIELKKVEMQNIISNSPMDANEKDVAMSKTYLYEVIDISVSEFSAMINAAKSSSDINHAIDKYKIEVIASIEKTVNRQIETYKTLGL